MNVPPVRNAAAAALTAVLVVVFGGALFVGPQAVATPTRATALPEKVDLCGEYLLIGVRGSGQTASDFGGWGREMASLRDLLRTRLNGVVIDELALDYPAESTDLLKPTDDQVRGFLAGGKRRVLAIVKYSTNRVGRYMRSIKTGVTVLRTQIESALERCENRDIILTGYSQGAIVVHRTLNKLSRVEAQSVVAVGLLADGDRTAKSAATYLGSASDKARGIAVFAGLTDTDIPASLAKRTFSYCDDDDIVCDATLFNLARFKRGEAIHTGYQAEAFKKLATSMVGKIPFAEPTSEVGRISFQHPTWGAATLIAANRESEAEFGSDFGRVRIEDSTGRTVWKIGSAMNYYPDEKPPPNPIGMPFFDVRAPRIDANGHIFLSWYTGRYDVVTVLRPVPGGMTDFKTLVTDVPNDGWGHDDSGGPWWSARFFYAEVVDVNGDGAFEIEEFYNDCRPDCAGGTTTSVIFAWNGQDYMPTS